MPHYYTDAGEVQWTVPGGKIEFGESLPEAAMREFLEETGLQTQVTGLLLVSEVLLPERPYHSITIAYSGKVVSGTLRAEPNHRFGEKVPRWFSVDEVRVINIILRRRWKRRWE